MNCSTLQVVQTLHRINLQRRKETQWESLLSGIPNPIFQRPVLKQHEFAPMGKLDPQGWTLIPRWNNRSFVHPEGWTLYGLEEQRGEQRAFTSIGDNFTPRVKSSPLGKNCSSKRSNVSLPFVWYIWYRSFQFDTTQGVVGAWVESVDEIIN
jgi:hypothetical protein